MENTPFWKILCLYDTVLWQVGVSHKTGTTVSKVVFLHILCSSSLSLQVYYTVYNIKWVKCNCKFFYTCDNIRICGADLVSRFRFTHFLATHYCTVTILSTLFRQTHSSGWKFKIFMTVHHLIVYTLFPPSESECEYIFFFVLSCYLVWIVG